jgi:hypothetical protein
MGDTETFTVRSRSHGTQQLFGCKLFKDKGKFLFYFKENLKEKKHWQEKAVDI